MLGFVFGIEGGFYPSRWSEAWCLRKVFCEPWFERYFACDCLPNCFQAVFWGCEVSNSVVEVERG